MWKIVMWLLEVGGVRSGEELVGESGKGVSKEMWS